jgi:hypothetical protein
MIGWVDERMLTTQTMNERQPKDIPSQLGDGAKAPRYNDTADALAIRGQSKCGANGFSATVWNVETAHDAWDVIENIEIT